MKRFSIAILLGTGLLLLLTECYRNKSYCPAYGGGGSAKYRTAPRFFGGSSTAQQVNVSHESYDTINQNQFRPTLEDPISTFSIDVDGASYANVRRMINQNSRPSVDAVRVEEFINYFNYDYEAPLGEHPFSITTEMATCPWQPDHYLMHVGLQGYEVETEALPASNLVFLLDVSGSMSSYDKLPLLKKSFGLLVDQLDEQDKVSIVVYAGAAGVVLPPTPGNQKGVIMKALEDLRSGGSTAGGEGIELAYNLATQNFIPDGNNRVIMATDGDFNVGMSSDSAMQALVEKKRESGVFLSVFGFGTGNLKDSKMERMSNHGNGNYSYIDSELEAKKVLVNEMGGTLLTIAKDVKIQVEFNPALVQEYRLIGYENRLLDDVDFDDDQKDAGELGAGHSVTAIYELIPATKGEAVDTFQTDVFGTTAWSAVRFRYKKPDENSSLLIEKQVVHQPVDLEQSSNDFRFSAAVAAFGMELNDSPYLGSMSLTDIRTLAAGAVGEDRFGYRQDFLKLVEKAEGGLGDL